MVVIHAPLGAWFSYLLLYNSYRTVNCIFSILCASVRGGFMPELAQVLAKYGYWYYVFKMGIQPILSSIMEIQKDPRVSDQATTQIYDFFNKPISWGPIVLASYCKAANW